MSSTPPQDSDETPTWKPAPAALVLFCQYLRGLEVDPDLDFEQVGKAHPDHARDLANLLEQYERVTGILESLTPTASFSVRLRERYGETIDPEISLSGGRPAGEAPNRSGSPTSGRVLSRLSAQAANTSRYETIGELARGGMGAIVEVWDKELRRTLAMKMVLGGKVEAGSSQSSEDQVERRLSRFLEEAQITGQLDHPGIVPVHDIGLDDTGRVYFTMQLVDGHDLRKVIELARLQREGWSPRRVVSVFVRVCEAMAYAHSKGVVHRDLKPANIMVGAFGEAFVMDWGLAKVLGKVEKEPTAEEKSADKAHKSKKKRRHSRVLTDRSDSDSAEDDALRTLDGDVVGTPAYMSPEQARGELSSIGVAADIYSMCAMLYHLLSGQAPYEPLGEKVPAHTVLEAVRNAPPWPLAQIDPNVDGELAAICQKGMAREPGDRYPSMRELGEDLRAWVEGRGVLAYESGTFYELRKWVSRNRMLAITGAIIPLVVFISLILFSIQQQRNVDRVVAEQKVAEKARIDADQARLEADENAKDALASEQAMSRALAQTQIESERAKEERTRADAAAKIAENQKQLADFSLVNAERIAYRSGVIAAASSLLLDDSRAARKSLDDCEIPMRGWEWRHLDIRTDERVGSRIRIRPNVTDLAVDGSGKTLLTYGLTQNPRLWEVAERAGMRVSIPFTFNAFDLNAEGGLYRCALAPKGGTLAVCNAGQTSFHVFNAVTGDDLVAAGDHERPITAISYSDDGRFLMTVAEDGAAKVFNAGGLQLLRTIKVSAEPLLDGAFDPAGTRLATCGTDRQTHIHRVTGEHLQDLAGHHTAPVVALDWSLDGTRVVTGDEAGGLAVWDAASGEVTTVMRGKGGGIHDVLFDASGLVVYSAATDGTVRMWNAASGFEERVFVGHEAEVRSLVRLGTTGEIASASVDKSIRIWSPEWNPGITRLALAPDQKYVSAVFSSDSRIVYAGTREAGIEAFDGDSSKSLPGYSLGQQSAVPGSPAAARPATIVRNVQAVARSTGRYVVGTESKTVEVYSGVEGKLERVLNKFDTGVKHLEISDDGERLVAGGGRGTVFSVDLKTGTYVGIDLHYGLMSLAISSDGKYIATGEANERLRLWDAATGEELGSRREAHSTTILDLAISADGKTLISGSKNNTARLWSLPEIEFMEPELAGHGGSVGAVAINPTEPRVATGGGDGRLRLWDMESHDLLLNVHMNGGAILDLDFSPDGKRLVVVTESAGAVILESEANELRYQDSANK